MSAGLNLPGQWSSTLPGATQEDRGAAHTHRHAEARTNRVSTSKAQQHIAQPCTQHATHTPSVGLSKLVKKRKKVAGAQAVPALAAEVALIDLVSSPDDERAVENEVFVGAVGDGDSILQPIEL